MPFDQQTAARLLIGKPVSSDQIHAFVQHARWTNDEAQSLNRVIVDLRRELGRREAEIALLKSAP